MSEDDPSGDDVFGRFGLIAQVVTIYTVRRIPYTAAAKSSAGYDSNDFEYVADGAKSALVKAIAECEWRDPESNFLWRVIGSRVVVLESDEGRGQATP